MGMVDISGISTPAIIISSLLAALGVVVVSLLPPEWSLSLMLLLLFILYGSSLPPMEMTIDSGWLFAKSSISLRRRGAFLR